MSSMRKQYLKKRRQRNLSAKHAVKKFFRAAETAIRAKAADAAEKIKSALKSRAGSDLVIIARTDAIAVEGLESAIDRAHAYAEAGCDVIFVEAPRSKEELARIANEIKEVPLLVNMLDGGKTPILSKAELEKMGYIVEDGEKKSRVLKRI